MLSSHLSRRAVLAEAAAAAALTAVPLGQVRAHAAEDTASSCRWRNVFIGGTGFVTGVLFHPSVRGLAYVRTDIGGAYRWFGKAAKGASYPAIYMAGGIEDFNAIYRSDDEAKTWTRINDGQHPGGWTGTAHTLPALLIEMQ